MDPQEALALIDELNDAGIPIDSDVDYAGISSSDIAVLSSEEEENLNAGGGIAENSSNGAESLPHEDESADEDGGMEPVLVFGPGDQGRGRA